MIYFFAMKNEIILYRPNDIEEHIEVRIEDETVWLTQAQMALLFQTTPQNITMHIGNVYKEAELVAISTCKDFLQVRKEGNREVQRKTSFYNLDVIISVGYRVKSKQGTQFRIWATQVLKKHLLKGYTINKRMNRLENNMETLQKEVKEINLQINSNLIPTQGVFYDGQVFDAYELASKIIRSAKSSIVLIDNYIDESAITHLTKKKKNVKVLFLTKTISKQLVLDIQKANEQYGGFTAKPFTQSHDRFIIIDGGKDVYHIGASLKDLGKKWFAFSKMESVSVENLVKVVSGLI
jgi:hypothetical protein